MSELYGIIKNALELGWSIPEIRDSLINSGYNPADIDPEIGKFSKNSSPVFQSSPQISKVLPTINLPLRDVSAIEEKKPAQLKEYQLPKNPEKKHNWLKIFLIVLAVLFFGFLSIVVYAFITSLLSM
jgi:hypothetical protein